MKYKSHTAKTTTAKKLAQETGTSIWEAERCLNADAFLDEYPRWEPLRFHCSFLLHQMFTHTMATGQKEHDWGICWGWQQPLPGSDLSAEQYTIELIGPRSTQEEIRGVYNDMYQLWRSPSKSPCNAEMEESICQEILDSVRECLQHRQDQAQPEERPRWSPASTSKPDPQVEFWDKMHATYDHF